MMKKLIINGSF